MDLSTKYNPKNIESKLYDKWIKLFKIENQKNKNYYIALMAPPNITGNLHMGHALQNILLDVLLRYKRMKGFKIIWLPGIDHAGIATQYVVERELKKEGLTRYDLGREEFIKRVWQWKEKNGNDIINQFKKLGICPDWSKIKFTLDKKYIDWVEKSFIEYYNKGWIYRDYRAVNFCPRCQTSLSDLELNYKEEEGIFYYIKYPIKDSNEFITIATTQPETMLGDVALAINPNDTRYLKYLGKIALLPIIKRELLIIADNRVDPKFGTGIIKVTPAHSLIDYEISLKHHLEIIPVINEQGKIINIKEFEGLSFIEARRKIIEILKNENLLEKEEIITHFVPYCDRCGTLIQVIPLQEWFLKMSSLANLAKKSIKNREIIFIPNRFKRISLNWLKNIRDWCISRKIWWGQRLPVWYCQICDNYIVCQKKPKSKCKKCNKNKWKRSEEVFDTWFSSALWPFAILYTPKEKKWYPTDIVFTARDILNLWITRMIFSGIFFMKKPPFKFVYVHPTVLTKEGKRMSKSLGTGIDPLDLINKYSIDSLRFGLIWQTSNLQDLRFDESAIEAGYKFSNKAYNAVRFFLIRYPQMKKSKKLSKKDEKIISEFNKTLKFIEINIENLNFSKALKKFYDFFWNNFCSQYIESCKEETKNNPEVLKNIIINSLKILSIFMPFLSDYLWQIINQKKDKYLINEKWPQKI
ncbi:MAG: valine--tRNA ligase [Candidatus Parcubacteria bacterium]|nr:MAG: valine--tRNA ligase [Candidatus Parcubacteria bacterium]